MKCPPVVQKGPEIALFDQPPAVRTESQIAPWLVATKLPVTDPPPLLVQASKWPSLREEPRMDGAATTSNGALLLDVAHDLRSLLLSFNVALEGLAEHATPLHDPEGDRRLLGTLQRSAVHLQTLLENVLDSASIGASRFGIVREPLDLAAVVREAVQVVSPLLRPRNQHVALDLSATLTPVWGDGQHLRRVLVNLLHNAIKYGPNAGTISVAAGSQEHMTRVAVTDQGPGIPLDEQARLFDRFYRGRAGRLAGRGTGLGLAIARAVVQAHGGQIGVYSEPGAGSTFWFTIANQ